MTLTVSLIRLVVPFVLLAITYLLGWPWGAPFAFAALLHMMGTISYVIAKSIKNGMK